MVKDNLHEKNMGGWSIYEKELTQEEYNALPTELKDTPKLIFVIKKDGA